jgi:hypothetical protein
MDALLIKHHRLRTFAAAILSSRKALPARANGRTADTTMGKLLGAFWAIGLRGVAKAIVLAADRFAAGAAARQLREAGLAELLLIDVQQIAGGLVTMIAAGRIVLALWTHDQSGTVFGVASNQGTATEMTKFMPGG